MRKTIILLPTYNELENIQKILPILFSFLPNIRIMVVDDNSPDGTADAVKKLQKQFLNLILFEREKKEGLGRAYTEAFKKVLTEFHDVEIIVTMDADLSHDYEKLPAMLELSKKNDLVIGSRYVSGGRIEGWESHRRILSSLGNRYVRLVTKLPIRDCTSGFNCIRANALRKLNFSMLDPSGYSFLIALKYNLWKQGARIIEYPITFKSRESGESKISMRIIEEGILLPWKLINLHRHAPVECHICNTQTANYWFTKNDCDIHKCSLCKLIFVSPHPDTTSNLYTKDYFCGANNAFGYVNYDEDKNMDSATFTKYIRRIEGIMPNKGRLLDIGAATGVFMKTANDLGWKTTGVEISEFAAETARNKGLDVHTGTLDTVAFPPASFDVITLWDVFEHLPNPGKILDSVNLLLAPNGILVLNLPDAGSAYARVTGKRWPLIIPPEHLYLFGEKNLIKILEKHAFTMLLTDKIGKSYTPAYIFQILYTVQRKNIWKTISNWIRKTPINRLSIPIHLRDNLFLIAKKK